MTNQELVQQNLEEWKRGSESGSGECSRKLGLCYKNGEGVLQDFEQAIACFEKGMEQGDIESTLELGYAYDENGYAETDFEKASNYYAEAYSAGSAQGAYCLGVLYESGSGVKQNYARAFSLYSFASEKGHAKATAKLGIFYHEGVGTEKDLDLASEYLKKAESMGESVTEDMFEAVHVPNAPDEDELLSGEDVGDELLEDDEEYDEDEDAEDAEDAEDEDEDEYDEDEEPDYDDLDVLMEDAKAGIPEAQYRLAALYLDSEVEGVEFHADKAVEMARQAADKGHVLAQQLMGIVYAKGIGVPQNYYESVKWHEKAAAQGDMYSKYHIANRLIDGRGTTKDLARAERLFKEVISDRYNEVYENAQFDLAHLYATELNNDYAAFPLWKQLAERGNSTAQFNLGLAYYQGKGTPKDEDQAIYWWRKAADQGDEMAQNNLEYAYQERQSNPGLYIEKPKRGCYVATAVYGSYDCPEVWTLRRFRDYVLAETAPGLAFIKLYYAVSPTLVKWFGETKWFKGMWRVVLDKMVDKLREDGFESTPYDDRSF